MLPVSILFAPRADISDTDRPKPVASDSAGNVPVSNVLNAISRHAASQPQAMAIRSGNRTINYGALNMMVDSLADRLTRLSTNTIGIFSGNCLDWLLTDLAAMRAGIPVAALPENLSGPQLRHAVEQSDITWILTDRSTGFATLAGLRTKEYRPLLNTLDALRIDPKTCGSIHATHQQKIFFNATEQDVPHGIGLATQHMEQVALALKEATAATPADRHVCLLPLHTALENIAGVYVSLLAGGVCIAPPLTKISPANNTGWNGHGLLDLLTRQQASTTIVTPTMLSAFIAALRDGGRPPASLRLVIVAGAPFSPGLIRDAIALGLPARGAYSLPECASIIAINSSGTNSPDIVGKPLPHIRMEIAGDGEILIHGAPFHGYLDQPSDQRSAGKPLATGDLGYLDREGYLHISGRKPHGLPPEETHTSPPSDAKPETGNHAKPHHACTA